MITEIQLHFGPSVGGPPLIVRPPRITVFVGPNNSGKSLALREIRSTLNEHPNPEQRRVIADVSAAFSPGLMLDLVKRRTVRETATSVTIRSRNGQSWELQRKGNDIVPLALPHFPHRLLTYYTLVLDGAARLNLSGPQPFSGFAGSEDENYWATLFRDGGARIALATDIRSAFERHLVLDAVTSIGQVIPRLSAVPIPTEIEHALTAESAQFFSKTTPLSDFSDGVKAYCGVLAALRSGDDRLVLIDEPDAFLHPPLARKLGETMARVSTAREGQVFAATHSAHFVMGAITAGVQVAIVRLSYDGRQGLARLLDEGTLSGLMSDPLLRATGILDALFHQSVIVCEGHSDRVLYEEVNTRLRAVGRGVHDCLLLNAGNWQNVRKLVGPMRALGIPAAAVVDLDVIRKTEFTALMKAAGVPDATAHGIRQQAGDIDREVATSGSSLKSGIGQLPDEIQRAIGDVCRSLAVYGVFLVPVGELEGWLGSLGVTANKSEWTSMVLDRLAATQLTPSDDDVWAFIDQIGRWLRSPGP